MISIIIPVIDQHEVTDRCIAYIRATTVQPYEIIVIDNGSDVPYQDAVVNGENKGIPTSLKQGYERAKGDIILFMHNDVLIHDHGWDIRVQSAFNDDPLLGVAGFFGGRGMNPDGGRVHPESNMLGTVWGSPWNHHGTHQTGIVPAAVLDGLAMFFRKRMLDEAGFPELPPHHWYDRILPLYYIDKGWRCATIGVGFDHGSGFTSSQEKSMTRQCIQQAMNCSVSRGRRAYR